MLQAYGMLNAYSRSGLAALHYYLLYLPLYHLYRFGPSLWGWGFWEGREDMDICAELTSTSSGLWLRESIPCQDLIARKFQAVMVFSQVILYFTVVFLLLRLVTGVLIRRWDPLVLELQKTSRILGLMVDDARYTKRETASPRTTLMRTINEPVDHGKQ